MLAKGLSDEALSGTGEAGDQDRLVGRDPAVLCELEELILAQAASGPVVEALDGGGPVFELGDPSRPVSLRFSR